MNLDIQGCADLAKERSKELTHWRIKLRLLSFGLTVPAIVFHFEWWEAMLILLPEVFGNVLEGISKEWFRLHRKWRGAGLICDSFGTHVSTELKNEVELKLGDKGMETVTARKRPPTDLYYTSKAPHGMQRLMENVQESVHYSARLSQQSHRRLLIWPVISGILGVGFFVFAPQIEAASNWVGLALVMMLVMLVLCDTVRNFFEFRKAEGEFRALEVLAENAAKNPQAAEVVRVLADYVLVSALSLPLDSNLFQEKKQQLQTSWDSRNID